jgi:pimeloyl-ACP methyl ester carboxylesterase
MRLNYTAKGQGRKTIILLHGWGGSLKSLTPLQDELIKSNEYRVFNIEWPGFGKSPIIHKSAKIKDYESLLLEFISEHNIAKPILVGHSFGGKVAMALAINNPNILDKLILINSSGLKPKNSLKKTLLFLPTKAFGAFFKLPLLKFIKKPIRKLYYKLIVRESDYLISEDLEITMKNILSENLDESVSKIQVQTLLIWGEKDTQTPLWMGKKLASEIPNSKLEVIKDAKHGLPLNQPEIVSTLILLFLK